MRRRCRGPGLTAWQGLFDHGRLAKGQTVVINGAGGAVGSTAVQLARWAGAEVIGTGRSRVRPMVTELGADRFIALDDPDTDHLEDVAGQADLVFDTIGGDVLARSPGPAAAGRHPGHDQGGPTGAEPTGTTSRPSSSSRSPAALS